MNSRASRSGRRAPRHAQIHLPPMDGEQAYLVVDVLERAVRAICRVHGDAIADYQGRVHPDAPPPADAVSVGNRDGDDGDFPF